MTAAKTAAKKTSKGAPNKSDFVRSQPKDMSAKDVVAKAKAAGMALTEMYVYSIRSKSKAAKKAAAPRAASAAVAAAPKAAAPQAQAKKHASTDSLTSVIEAIVERKVNAMLQARFKSLLGS